MTRWSDRTATSVDSNQNANREIELELMQSTGGHREVCQSYRKSNKGTG